MKSNIEQRRIVAYLDGVQAWLASLRELRSQTQEELDALLPSVLRSAGVPFRPYQSWIPQKGRKQRP